MSFWIYIPVPSWGFAVVMTPFLAVKNFSLIWDHFESDRKYLFLFFLFFFQNRRIRRIFLSYNYTVLTLKKKKRIFPDIDALWSESDPQESAHKAWDPDQSRPHLLWSSPGPVASTHPTWAAVRCTLQSAPSAVSHTVLMPLCQTAPAFSSNLSLIKHFHLQNTTDWLLLLFLHY